ncbi:hypothetical protein FFK22_036770 [Mycobacterium sp. KBS0706]|uniref:hypothetical protein n=1 Tax=Mycobacterium sp. KBS0706 TaxID=2578109 RepID=UPI00110F984C|nr:hypothetical protein [Mycobacterium sp. KBS0706]TSD83646.1 hypothetical protein FFK22_036770 [Mycobacterium sp. KBS0706]
MAITKRPVQHRSDIASPPTEAAAERFIQGAAPSAPEAKRQNMEPVIVRFDPDQLAEIDRRAAGLGLSRSAWLRMMVTQVLKG